VSWVVVMGIAVVRRFKVIMDGPLGSGSCLIWSPWSVAVAARRLAQWEQWTVAGIARNGGF
jgi:hypothetical protein